MVRAQQSMPAREITARRLDAVSPRRVADGTMLPMQRATWPMDSAPPQFDLRIAILAYVGLLVARTADHLLRALGDILGSAPNGVIHRGPSRTGRARRWGDRK